MRIKHRMGKKGEHILINPKNPGVKYPKAQKKKNKL